MSELILVTGAAGFIGFHTCKRLLESGYSVVGVDNLNDYYEVTLKQARLSILLETTRFTFLKIDISDKSSTFAVFKEYSPSIVIHLAAQAGVRYSISNPYAYAESNLLGFLNILECCRHNKIKHLVYASSSSVYGANVKLPFSVTHNVDHPVSFYAATKKANELMAHSYSHLYDLPTTGLRFFTVYGPWGRPDMAMFIFTKAILQNKPINIFNNGEMERDFTYIDDIVDGIIKVMTHQPVPQPELKNSQLPPNISHAPYRIYNIGNNRPVKLLYLIQLLEQNLGKTAIKNFLPMQPGDVQSTFADITDIANDVGFKPSTPIEEGVKKFIKWFKDYYHIS